jgi:hypothetical protein
LRRVRGAGAAAPLHGRQPRAAGGIVHGTIRAIDAIGMAGVQTMSTNAFRVFLSYRRDDAAGYAGRLEESLERRLGRGSVFRDVGDIAPGEDFVHVIRARLAEAQGVLVLIGRRWAGTDASGARRIDDEDDFVRLEVQEALASGARVVPVLLPGATMPSEDDLPVPLKALARRHALTLDDLHWAAGVDRLLAGLGHVPRRKVWPWALGAAALGALAVAAWCGLGAPDAGDDGTALLGRWEAEVRYDWGDRFTERFEFERHAGGLTGTAGYLRHPRAIENLRFDGANLHFQTRTRLVSGSEERELTHAYAAELRGRAPDQVLAFRMQSSGGFGGGHTPITFEARRVAAPDPAASEAVRRPPAAVSR